MLKLKWQWNKLFVLLLAIVMAFNLTAPAFAAEDGAANTMNYTDVSESDWFFFDVLFVTEQKLMDGLTKTAFGPDEDMTRQMLAAALYRLAGSPEVTIENPFTDVADNAAYRDAVVWAYSAGVVNGVTETAFRPDSPIQRQAIAVMLARYAKIDTAAYGGTDLGQYFSDAGEIQSFAAAAMDWAVINDIMQGSDGLLKPQGSTTRAQAAAVLGRFHLKQELAENPPQYGLHNPPPDDMIGADGNLILGGADSEVPEEVKQAMENQAGALNCYQKILDSFEKGPLGFPVYPDEYAGAYIDNGALMVLLVDNSSEIQNKYMKLCGDSKAVQFKKAGYSMKELQSCESYAVELVNSGYGVASYGVNEKENVFEIILNSQNYDESAFPAKDLFKTEDGRELPIKISFGGPAAAV